MSTTPRCEESPACGRGLSDLFDGVECIRLFRFIPGLFGLGKGVVDVSGVVGFVSR